MIRCKECKWWKNDWVPDYLDYPVGDCECPKFVVQAGVVCDKDGIRTFEDYYDARYQTGHDFGCVHGEAREQDYDGRMPV